MLRFYILIMKVGIHNDGQGVTESEFESDGDNAKVDTNTNVESSVGVYGRRPSVESRRPTFPIFRPVARAKDIRFELGMLLPQLSSSRRP